MVYFGTGAGTREGQFLRRVELLAAWCVRYGVETTLASARKVAKERIVVFEEALTGGGTHFTRAQGYEGGWTL